MKRKKVRTDKKITVIGFLYTPAVVIFCADKPIFIARNEKDIFMVLNNIDPKRKGKIYYIEYSFAAYLFEAEWWQKLKSDFLNFANIEKITKEKTKTDEDFLNHLMSLEGERQLKKLEEVEYFLLECEKGIWN